MLTIRRAASMNIAATIFVLLRASPALADVDYACISSCTSRLGFSYQYCEQACSYNTGPSKGSPSGFSTCPLSTASGIRRSVTTVGLPLRVIICCGTGMLPTIPPTCIVDYEKSARRPNQKNGVSWPFARPNSLQCLKAQPHHELEFPPRGRFSVPEAT